MAQTEAQKRAVEKYKKLNYDFIKVRLKKGEKERLMQDAQDSGISLNAYIRNRLGLE